MNRCGFKIIKENRTYYGYTVLCQKSNEKVELKKDDYKALEKDLEKQKQAISYIMAPLPDGRNPEKAIEIYPKFPEGYIYHAISFEKMKKFEVGKEIIEKGLKIMPGCHKLVSQMGVLCMQWDEQKPNKKVYFSNNVKKAEEYFNKCLEVKPADEHALYFLSIIEGHYKKNYEKAVQYMKKVIEINPLKWAELWDKISFFWKDK